MSIDQINPVESTPPSQSLSVGNSPTREVTDKEASDFAKSVEPQKPDYSKATMEDVKKYQFEVILNNMINDAPRQRQELKEATEDQN
jgi:hypothetical protein